MNFWLKAGIVGIILLLAGLVITAGRIIIVLPLAMLNETLGAAVGLLLLPIAVLLSGAVAIVVVGWAMHKLK